MGNMTTYDQSPIVFITIYEKRWRKKPLTAVLCKANTADSGIQTRDRLRGNINDVGGAESATLLPKPLASPDMVTRQ